MRVDLADIRVRTALTIDGRVRMVLEYPAEDAYRDRAMQALTQFLRPAEPSGQPTDSTLLNPGESSE